MPQARSAVVLLAVSLAVVPTDSNPALAQGDPFAWFEQLFRPPPSSRVARPRPEFHRAAPQTARAATLSIGRARPGRSAEKADCKGARKTRCRAYLFRRGAWRQPRSDAGARADRGVRKPAGGRHSSQGEAKVQVSSATISTIGSRPRRICSRAARKSISRS